MSAYMGESVCLKERQTDREGERVNEREVSSKSITWIFVKTEKKNE